MQAIAVLTAISFRKRHFMDETPSGLECNPWQSDWRSGLLSGLRRLPTIAASKSGSDMSPAIRSNPFMRNLSALTGSMYIVADPESPSGKAAVDLMIQMPFTSAQRPSP